MIKRNRDEHPPAKRYSDVAGIILAGGKSSRYGRNKALVEFRGLRLIEHAVGTIRALFRDVILVTNTPADYAFLELPMVEDAIKGLGPLGGIYTGLRTISEETGFIVACDMPFLNEGLLRHMVDTREAFDAVIPRMGPMIEPLHAIYTRNCLPVMKDALDSKGYQIAKCLPKLRIKYLDEEELRAYDPELMSFFNINKPKDLQLCLN